MDTTLSLQYAYNRKLIRRQKLLLDLKYRIKRAEKNPECRVQFCAYKIGNRNIVEAR